MDIIKVMQYYKLRGMPPVGSGETPYVRHISNSLMKCVNIYNKLNMQRL